MKIFLPLFILFSQTSISPSLITLSISIFLLLFLSSKPLMIMSSFIYIDYISLMMILLSLISTLLIFISTLSFKKNSLFISFILMFLILTFSSSSFLLFYLLFEIIMIPTLILITKFGYQPERLQAGIYLFMYTIFASLPLLLSILNLEIMSFIMMSIMCMKFSLPLLFMLAFLVKLPMFFTHLWLPKAHVEAPVEGSMILAAILLKLGGYGIIRISPMLINSINKMNFWIISLSALGASATSLICIRQKDLKSLIAYSSVAHMGFILSSMMTLSKLGMMGALIMMIGHGFSSSALFFVVNIIYSKFHTRNIISFKGMINLFPNLMFWWFILMAINISAPPSINFFSEILMMSSIMQWNFSFTLMIILISLTSASFSIFMFVNIAHNISEMLPNPLTLQKNFMSLFIHVIPLLLLIYKLEIMM